MDSQQGSCTVQPRLPNTAAMKVAKDRLNKAVVGRVVDFMPSLLDKVSVVAETINKAHHQLFNDINQIQASLGNVGIAGDLRSIHEIQNNTHLASATKTEQTEKLLKYACGRIGASQYSLTCARQNITRTVAELATTTFEGNAAGLRKTFEVEAQSIERRILSDKGDLVKLAGEKRVIDEALQLFKAPGWLDIFRSMVPSAEEIEAALKLVSTKKPDKEFLQMVLSKLQGNLEGIDQGRQFDNLAQARDAVRDRMSTLEREIKADELQVRELLRKISGLDELDAMDSTIRNWSDEVTKLTDAYACFLDANNPERVVDVPALTATAQRYDVFVQYLKSIKRS